MTITQMYLVDTDEKCTSCGAGVVVVDPGADELTLECDCGPTSAAA